MTSRNSIQEMCSGPEFSIGEMYALREFKTYINKDDEHGLGAVMHDSLWADGHDSECAVSMKEITPEVYETFKRVDPTALEAAGIEIFDYRTRSSDDFSQGTYTGGKISGGAITAGNIWVAPASSAPPTAASLKSASSMSYFYSWSGSSSNQPIQSIQVTAPSMFKPKKNACYMRVTHQVPAPDCTCGYYAYHSIEAMEKNQYKEAWVSVIRAHGRIVLGEKGLRAQKAEVVALVPMPRFYSQFNTTASNSEAEARREAERPAAARRAQSIIETLVEDGLNEVCRDPELALIFSEDSGFRGTAELMLENKAKFDETTKGQNAAKQKFGPFDPDANVMSYAEFNTLYYVAIKSSSWEREYSFNRKLLMRGLTELFVDRALKADRVDDGFTQHSDFGRISHLVKTGAEQNHVSALLSIAKRHPKAVFFKTVDEMLAQFPLTGPDEFRGNP